MEFIRIGSLTNTHGVRGDFKVFPQTDEPGRFELVREIYVKTKDRQEKLKVKQVKYHKNMVILHVEEWNDINQVLPFKGADILIPMEEALPLDDNENYIFQIIGLTAIDESDGKQLGPIVDVLSTGAHDVYVIDDGSKNGLMIPARPIFIKKVDLENKTMIVHLIDGLKGL